MPAIPPIDIAVLLWFFVCWAGYAWFAGRKGAQSASLLLAMRKYRQDWFAQMFMRENRVGDLITLNSLLSGATFFASTSLLILGGLVAMLGTTEQVMGVVSELPFAKQESELIWRLKIIVLLIVFVYAFFKFTWSIRQFNFCSILVGAAPARTDEPGRHEDFIKMITDVASFSADNFNQGLRAYYFALAALTWFLQPWLFVLASAAVVVVLYSREFHSRTLQALTGPAYADGHPAPIVKPLPGARSADGGF